jgi:hypothetical protein
MIPAGGESKDMDRKMARKRKVKTKKKGTQNDAPKYQYSRDFKPDKRSWICKNPSALPIAQHILDSIESIGAKKVADKISIEISKYIWYRAEVEHKELSDTDKTNIGTICEEVLLKMFGWTKNDEGKDTTLRIKVLGVEINKDIDFKSSVSSYNKNHKMPSGWQISLECQKDICILVSYCPITFRFSLGILDCSVSGYLSPIVSRSRTKGVQKTNGGGPKRDKKRPISTKGKENILWLIFEIKTVKNPMPEHRELFLRIRAKVDRMLEQKMMKLQSHAEESTEDANAVRVGQAQAINHEEARFRIVV